MADQIKVNDAAWSALSAEDQAAIKDIVAQSFGDVSIVGDSNAPAPQAGFKFPGGSSICKLLCDIAATAGHMACEKVPAPARPICNAGVDAAQALCKSKCK